MKLSDQSFLARHGLKIVLLVAFAFTSLLAIQQQRTIDSQQTLIRQLFSDSVELSNLKLRTIRSARRNER